MAPLQLILAAALQGGAPIFRPDEVVVGAIQLSTGLATALLVYRLAGRMPWPTPFRFRFAAVHVVAAPVAAIAWYLMSSGLEAAFGVTAEGSDRVFVFLFLGTIFYAIVVGISHAVEASARAARAEAVAARTQLAALRAQLQPHFLFNALHTVVQLIPSDPGRATEAAELVADLLRATLDDQRDEVTLDEEWSFVARYLALERIRFGDRLVVRADLSAELLGERVPAFALQTLVENAVRHGAAPRVAATEIVIAAAVGASELSLSVRNSWDGGGGRDTAGGVGTGLARLRERLAVLYRGRARLVCGPAGDGGFEALLVLPRSGGREW